MRNFISGESSQMIPSQSAYQSMNGIIGMANKGESSVIDFDLNMEKETDINSRKKYDSTKQSTRATFRCDSKVSPTTALP